MSVVDQYAESELHTLLIEDERISEQGIRVVRMEGGVALVGEVESAGRRDLIMQVVGERFPDLHVQCDIGLTRVHEPEDVEEL